MRSIAIILALSVTLLAVPMQAQTTPDPVSRPQSGDIMRGSPEQVRQFAIFRARHNNDFNPSSANVQLMMQYIQNKRLGWTAENLEVAFNALKAQLAPVEPGSAEASMELLQSVFSQERQSSIYCASHVKECSQMEAPAAQVQATPSAQSNPQSHTLPPYECFPLLSDAFDSAQVEEFGKKLKSIADSDSQVAGLTVEKLKQLEKEGLSVVQSDETMEACTHALNNSPSLDINGLRLVARAQSNRDREDAIYFKFMTTVQAKQYLMLWNKYAALIRDYNALVDKHNALTLALRSVPNPPLVRIEIVPKVPEPPDYRCDTTFIGQLNTMRCTPE